MNKIMRHILLAFFFLICVNAVAQEGLSDTEENGTRVITAPFIIDGDIRYSGSWAFSVSGQKEKYAKAIIWSIGVAITGTNSSIYPEQPGMLIRFADGKVIELRAVIVNDIDRSDDRPVGILLFPLTEAQLKMFEAGISKIRVELKNDYVERRSLPDVGETIYVAYTEIKKQFGRPRKTYADGF